MLFDAKAREAANDTLPHSPEDLDEATADHSTIPRARRLIDVETHRHVFAGI